MNVLSDKAMLAGISIRQWSGSRIDHNVTADIHRQHGADQSSGRYNKKLIDPAALSEIRKSANLARKAHYQQTLPWLDDGSRVLPAKGFDKYSREMREYKANFEQAVKDFLGKWNDHLTDAQISLNGMFDANDYPSLPDLRSEYAFKTIINPMPDSDDFRVQVGSDNVDAIREQIEERTKEATELAVADVMERISSTVGHMRDKLDSYKPSKGKGTKAQNTFKDSLVGNVQELVDLLPSLNVTNSPQIAQIAQDMGSRLCGVDAQTLRDDTDARSQVASDANSIMSKLDDIL